MAVINSTKAAELILERTGRPCSRQNLEAHVRAGRLPKSTVQLGPIRVDADLVVAEFIANVDPAQAWSLRR
jgi:hypothetical protein